MEENITNVIVSTDQVLSAEDYPYTLSLRRKDLDDEKSLNKFIVNCEKLVRISPEYRVWTYYVRDVLGYTTCSITGEKNNELSVHIHHHPYTLYEIIKGLILENIEKNKEFCSFDISTKCIELHYENRVPFVPIVASLHEKYHNERLEIPLSLCHGDINYFLEHYSFRLEDDEQKRISTRLSITKENCGWSVGYKWIENNEQ